MPSDDSGHHCVAERPRNPDTDLPEDPFRAKVRDVLGLDPFTRNQKIFDELRRLKKLDDLLAANPLAADSFLASLRA